ncbi:MAG: D-alanyl-D-alanine carboxypeptidase family protein [Clostridiaceae bacterium]|nr:D-alanyl-D-alanine carboxypeptidase [Eubacteriales bacterium]
MKRFVTALLVLCLAISFLPAAAHAEFDPDKVSTPHIVLMDADTGAILYQKNARDQAYPASTTKIMTAIVALENADLDDQVAVGNSVETKGSCMEIKPGEKFSLRDLMYGMMLKSGNDAARAIAEYVSGSQDSFVALMNEKAQSLGMTGTHFVKPNGLHKDDHYTTAYDMAILTQYAMKNPTFREIVKTGSYQVKPTNKHSAGFLLENTNKLIYTAQDKESFEYRYATGVKTGDTPQAGRCLVAAATKNGINLILVLFGDLEGKIDGDYRFENAAKFFDWGFANYATVTPAELGLPSTLEKSITNASFEDDQNGQLIVNIDFSDKKVCGLSDFINELKANAAAITTSETLDRALVAPIEAGDVLGTIAYQYDGQTLFTANMVASRSVAEITVSTSDNPSPSPFLIGSPGDGGKAGSPWVFWLIVIIALLLILVVLRVLTLKKKARRRAARRRRTAYRVYRR